MVEVFGVVADSFKLVWEVAVGFALLGSVLVFMGKQIKLWTELDTEYGTKKSARKTENAEKI